MKMHKNDFDPIRDCVKVNNIVQHSSVVRRLVGKGYKLPDGYKTVSHYIHDFHNGKLYVYVDGRTITSYKYWNGRHNTIEAIKFLDETYQLTKEENSVMKQFEAERHSIKVCNREEAAHVIEKLLVEGYTLAVDTIGHFLREIERYPSYIFIERGGHGHIADSKYPVHGKVIIPSQKFFVPEQPKEFLSDYKEERKVIQIKSHSRDHLGAIRRRLGDLGWSFRTAVSNSVYVQIPPTENNFKKYQFDLSSHGIDYAIELTLDDLYQLRPEHEKKKYQITIGEWSVDFKDRGILLLNGDCSRYVSYELFEKIYDLESTNDRDGINDLGITIVPDGGVTVGCEFAGRDTLKAIKKAIDNRKK